MKITREIMVAAHKMTKEIKAEFKEVNYSFQLGLCMSYLIRKGENKMNTITMQNEIRNAKVVSFEIEGETLEIVNEGLDFENNCMVSIDLDGEKLEGTFDFVYKTLCMLLDVKEFEFVNVKTTR